MARVRVDLIAFAAAFKPFPKIRRLSGQTVPNFKDNDQEFLVDHHRNCAFNVKSRTVLKAPGIQ